MSFGGVPEINCVWVAKRLKIFGRKYGLDAGMGLSIAVLEALGDWEGRIEGSVRSANKHPVDCECATERHEVILQNRSDSGVSLGLLRNHELIYVKVRNVVMARSIVSESMYAVCDDD